jgi:hypothetical protein
MTVGDIAQIALQPVTQGTAMAPPLLDIRVIVMTSRRLALAESWLKACAHRIAPPPAADRSARAPGNFRARPNQQQQW